MSKQSEAKAAQKYSPSLVLPTCNNCVNFTADRVLPEWMIKSNERYSNSEFTLEKHGVQKNLRCGIGGFAVKKMGSCNLFVARSAA
jgi:hypothetical protein